MKALPKILLALTGVAALSLAHPASVQAAPATYTYTGKPFTELATGPYTSSDFVTAMMTLASPLPPSAFTSVTPLAFSISDGVQTITNLNVSVAVFAFTTGGAGRIANWTVLVTTDSGNFISTNFHGEGIDVGSHGDGFGIGPLGAWTQPAGTVPDAGSSLALLSLSLTALGVAARQFKRAAA